MEKLIRFVDYDCDGCGTIVQSLVKVKGDITIEDVQEVQKIVNRLKNEDECWDFDTVVEDACAEYFGSKNIPYEGVGIDFEIEL